MNEVAHGNLIPRQRLPRRLKFSGITAITRLRLMIFARRPAFCAEVCIAHSEIREGCCWPRLIITRRRIWHDLAESLRSAELSQEGLREALLYYTRTATTLAGHHGCFVTNTALEMVPDDQEVTERVTRIFRRMVALLTAAIVRGQAAGIFNPELDERTIGNFLLCAIQGLRVLGKVNHNEIEMAGIVDMVMRALT